MFGVSIVIFVVMRVLPGDPLVAIFGPEGYTKLTPAERASYMVAARAERSADRAVLALDARHRLRQLRPFVLPLRERGGHDAAARALDRGDRLAVGRCCPGSSAFRWRIVSALRPNSWATTSRGSSAFCFLAVPGFWFGMLIVLAMLFWFGYRPPLANVSLLDNPWGNLQIVIGPAVVLGLGQAAYIARMARSTLLEVMREDYVRTARAKGLSGAPRDRAARAAQRACCR